MNLSFKKQENPPDYPPQVVLASQSVGRRTLLEKLGLRFRVIVTHVNEDGIVDKDPYRMLMRRAKAKAEEVFKNPHVYGIPDMGKTLLIAADSMGVAGTKTYGKALDRDNAKEIIKNLMGKTHIFATAVCLIYLENGKEIKRWEKECRSRVTLRKLNPADLESYTSRYDFTRFAAGYSLNETPWDLVTKIDGSYTNVIGLPFEVLLPVLRNLKIIV